MCLKKNKYFIISTFLRFLEGKGLYRQEGHIIRSVIIILYRRVVTRWDTAGSNFEGLVILLSPAHFLQLKPFLINLIYKNNI